MSTFTRRGDVVTCDRCNSTVEPGWKKLAQHLCPRIVADPFARPCTRCGQAIRSQDSRTRFCSVSCATLHRTRKTS